MSLIQGGSHKVNTTAFYPKTIDQSLRFEDGDSAYLSRTPASAGNRKTFTWSGWVKRGNLTSTPILFGVGSGFYSGGSQFLLHFYNNELRVMQYIGGYNLLVSTTALFRDPSAWYHIVMAIDTTQATSTDRIKLWVNGALQTNLSSTTYPSLNYDTLVNSTNAHCISGSESAVHFDGYMAEVHFTDGTAYTADSFGELKSGIWTPKAPSVTYGTNGFYLDFADSAAIGDDESGNTNDWTATNLVASDVVPDSPTNNFCTMNPLNGSRTLSQGNLRTVATSATYRYSTFAIPSSGKWYWEMLHESDYRSSRFGFANAEALGTGSGDFSGIESSSGGNDFRFDDQTSTDITDFMTSGGTGVIAFAVDMDAGEFDVYLDGALQTSGTFTSTSDKFVYERSGSTYTIVHFYNFGQDSTFAGNRSVGGNSDANGIGDFAYAPPSGYLALCTSNLPDPVIDPAQDATPEDHFNTVLYTGDGLAPRSITGIGFQPDWTWIKARSSAYGNIVYDAVRGAGQGNELVTNTTDAEGANSVYANLTSFDSDGFSIGSSSTTPNVLNNSGTTFVAWNWKAGGTASTIAVGEYSTGPDVPSIASTVSANTEAGFSIVKYNGDQNAGTSVGHGLTQAPEMMIVKCLGYARDWTVYHKNIASDAETDYLELNSTTVAIDGSDAWNDQAPTSSVFYLGNGTQTNDASGGTATIAYCFHSVDGFSKCGSYIGNGSADGPFVYTGFRPAFVLTKRSDSASDWHILDNQRSAPYNVVDGFLYPNKTSSEAVADALDIVSNGFKIRFSGSQINGSGATYIYLAFAEQPFKLSNAR
jgi:hypothetical protein